MDSSVYSLLRLPQECSPQDVMQRCQTYLEEWTLTAVARNLRRTMSPVEAAVMSQKVFSEGTAYLKAAAAMLMDPSARQCYDAWLDVQTNPTPEKITLTRARLSWFNGQTEGIRFADNMIASLEKSSSVPAKRRTKRKFSTKPLCRKCSEPFCFQDPYLVLHCHCTTRVGHVKCMNEFVKDINNKCPVCRQQLLQRHQVSKYLFWNVKKKFKFIA
tara:strand:+ start:2975 stop:3619 length:645 start_codon:yes stop_codon:yes gene_type:complete